MKLATIRTSTVGTAAVRIDDDEAVETGYSDVGALLLEPDWRNIAARAEGIRHDAATLDYAPVIRNPEKIICVGLNYRSHILEMGREIPEYPTLFAKFPSALIGAYDDIVLPGVSDAVDWEAELAVVIGTSVRHRDVAQAHSAIAGYCVLNDITARDWQYRTVEWLQGKTFESTTPIGPYLVTADEFDIVTASIEARLDDEIVQSAKLDDLVFGPAELIAYLSRVLTLRPGDIIATGTPGGVGHARDPKRYLTAGAVITTTVTGLGECHNRCQEEKIHAA
ncbi:fumarylacetoacetate hydrolase family protein [Mycobacterium sp. 663a-19]|uniref:fumarylacetoacetate hydrolase family protein n=1 Tax=Mycobacterium sp. 663a-19 TaxID=2986148 RepID=UPI002D1E661B|nr:fumarylacetoacetate hydrolase family protein [Mycobacterium sp. 663a-19]MEB3980076.1 fumarylacetoacetate hydrolase family protein [Mycobacterium sp. 663a-19]